MELKIGVNGERPKPQKKEIILTLGLSLSGQVAVKAYNPAADAESTIAIFDPEKGMRRVAFVSTDLGLPLEPKTRRILLFDSPEVEKYGKS